LQFWRRPFQQRCGGPSAAGLQVTANNSAGRLSGLHRCNRRTNLHRNLGTGAGRTGLSIRPPGAACRVHNRAAAGRLVLYPLKVLSKRKAERFTAGLASSWGMAKACSSHNTASSRTANRFGTTASAGECDERLDSVFKFACASALGWSNEYSTSGSARHPQPVPGR
jgi:hypothetical protein